MPLISKKVRLKLWQVLFDAIVTVEKKYGKGEGAKKLRAAIDIINSIINIPIIPEFAEDALFKLVIEAVIWFLNKGFGHQWIEKIKPEE